MGTPGGTRKTRKARFRAALALAHLSHTKWADKEGVHPNHLYLVLSGKRDSARLLQKIEAFISKYLPPTLDAA